MKPSLLPQTNDDDLEVYCSLRESLNYKTGGERGCKNKLGHFIGRNGEYL